MKHLAWKGMAMLGVAASVGCTSYAATAKVYAGAGRHELAALYWAGAYSEAPNDAACRDALTQSLEAATKGLEHDSETLRDNKQYSAALGAALRREDVLRSGRALGIAQFDVQATTTATQALQKQAAAAAVGAVDALETADSTPQALLAALRVAQSFKPDDPELARRYERIKSRLAINMTYKVDCQGTYGLACRAFASHFLSAVLGSDSELVRLVPADSQANNAVLEIKVGTALVDTPWERIKGGKLETRIQTQNRFRERDAYQTVSATYTMYRRSSRATLQVAVQVRDAGPTQKMLFQVSPTHQVTDERTYVDWQGDERALAELGEIQTDQTPPLEAALLSVKAARDLGADVAKQLLHQLDGSSSP